MDLVEYTVYRTFCDYLDERGVPELASEFGVVGPLLHCYVNAHESERLTAPPKARRGRKPPVNPNADLDSTAVDDEPTVRIHPGPASMLRPALIGLGIAWPKGFLLQGRDAPGVVWHFNNMAAQRFITPGGYSIYCGERGGGRPGERWLHDIVSRVTLSPVCEKCAERWLDPLAEDYLRFMAIGFGRTAELIRPWLTHLAPYVRGVGLTADGDLIFAARY